jgi:phosphatidylglycerophosphatase A
VLHAQGTQNPKGDVVNDDDDYSLVDEVVHYGTIIFLLVMTITFLGVVAGFVWGSL